MKFTDLEIKKYFKKWWIYDCAIRDAESFSFLLLEKKMTPQMVL